MGENSDKNALYCVTAVIILISSFPVILIEDATNWAQFAVPSIIAIIVSILGEVGSRGNFEMANYSFFGAGIGVVGSLVCAVIAGASLGAQVQIEYYTMLTVVNVLNFVLFAFMVLLTRSIAHFN